MAKTRIKKKCGKCNHIGKSPFIHCSLGCQVIKKYINKERTEFEIIPLDSNECKHKRSFE